MKIRFSPRASISIALVEVGNFARKKDEWKKKREEGRNGGGKRVGRRKKREEEGTAAFHNLISTSSSLVDPGTSLYRRSNATPPPTFRLNSFSRGGGVDIEQFSNCLAQRLGIIVPSSF